MINIKPEFEDSTMMTTVKTNIKNAKAVANITATKHARVLIGGGSSN